MWHKSNPGRVSQGFVPSCAAQVNSQEQLTLIDHHSQIRTIEYSLMELSKTVIDAGGVMGEPVIQKTRPIQILTSNRPQSRPICSLRQNSAKKSSNTWMMSLTPVKSDTSTNTTVRFAYATSRTCFSLLAVLTTTACSVLKTCS